MKIFGIREAGIRVGDSIQEVEALLPGTSNDDLNQFPPPTSPAETRRVRKTHEVVKRADSVRHSI